MNQTKQNKSHKGVAYTLLSLVAAISFVAVIIAAVLSFLWASKGYGVWLFYFTSAEILPIFFGAAIILFSSSVILLLSMLKNKLRKPLFIALAAIILVVLIVVSIIELTLPDNFYTVKSSEGGEYTILICEQSKGGENNVIFYQIIDGIGIQSLSSSRCIATGYRPISSGSARIEWNGFAFGVIIQTEAGEKTQMYSCIID